MGIHHPGRDTFFSAGGAVEPVGKGAALNRVSPVQNQGVAVVGKGGHAVGKSRGRRGTGGIVQGGKIAVDVAGKADGQIAVHKLPP